MKHDQKRKADSRGTISGAQVNPQYKGARPVDQKRLNAFIAAYAEALTAAVRANPDAWKLQFEDTPETKALRVALKTAYMIENYGIEAVMWQNDTFETACRALRVSHSEDAIRAYLEGGK